MTAAPAPTITDWVPPFKPEEVNERILYLAERCRTFLESVGRKHPSWDLSLDPYILIDATQGEMDDIWRYKVYHLKNPTKRSDAVKRAAYLTKWIVRLRPIQVSRPLTADKFDVSFDPKDASLFINEAFALHVSLGTLGTDAKVQKIALSPEATADILYDLHFRFLSDDARLLFYKFLLDTAKKTPIIVS